MPECTQPTKDIINAELPSILDGTSDKDISWIITTIKADIDAQE